jgi:hypothetical protein
MNRRRPRAGVVFFGLRIHDKIAISAHRALSPGDPMKLAPLTLPAVLALLAPAHPAVADTLLIQRTEAASHANLPKRGASMAAVEAAFGAPSAQHAPVGGGSVHTPPITRWDYPTFSVYFENSHVVNAVLAKASELEIGPAPATKP